MNDAEALEEAKRRWGVEGYVRRRTGPVDHFLVGVRDGVLFWVKGEGATWEEAFALADGNAKKLA